MYFRYPYPTLTLIPQGFRVFEKALKFIDDDRLRGLWYFIALTGCRRGEALGLRWEDIDSSAKTVTIQRTLTGTGKTRRVQEPKTARSLRTMALSTVLVEVLRQHRKTQLVERVAAGPEWHESGYVFTARNGEWLDPNWARKRFKALCKAAKLPETTRIHDLRHSLATTWLAHGIPVQVVAERLGHASIAITLSLYAHVLPNQQAQAAEEIDAMLAPPATISPLREHGNGDIP